MVLNLKDCPFEARYLRAVSRLFKGYFTGPNPGAKIIKKETFFIIICET